MSNVTRYDPSRSVIYAADENYKIFNGFEPPQHAHRPANLATQSGETLTTIGRRSGLPAPVAKMPTAGTDIQDSLIVGALALVGAKYVLKLVWPPQPGPQAPQPANRRQ